MPDVPSSTWPVDWRIAAGIAFWGRQETGSGREVRPSVPKPSERDPAVRMSGIGWGGENYMAFLRTFELCLGRPLANVEDREEW